MLYVCNFVKNELMYRNFSSILTTDFPGSFKENLFLQKQLFSKNTFSGCFFKHYLTVMAQKIQVMLKSFTKGITRKFSPGYLVKSNSPILFGVVFPI